MEPTQSDPHIHSSISCPPPREDLLEADVELACLVTGIQGIKGSTFKKHFLFLTSPSSHRTKDSQGPWRPPLRVTLPVQLVRYPGLAVHVFRSPSHHLP